MDYIRKLAKEKVRQLYLEGLSKAFAKYGIEGTEDKIKQLYKGKEKEDYLNFYYNIIRRQ